MLLHTVMLIYYLLDIYGKEFTTKEKNLWKKHQGCYKLATLALMMTSLCDIIV